MFTRFKRKPTRREISAYLQMLEAAQTDIKQNAIVQQNNKNTAKMSEKTTNAANVEAINAGTENAAETPKNGGFSFAKSFNKTTFDIDVTDFEYVKLSALYNAAAPQTVYKVNAMWVTKSPLGDSPVFVCAELGKLVNMPQHTAAMVREIVSNTEAVEAIKNGKVGFTVYEYESHGKKCYNVRFVDL